MNLRETFQRFLASGGYCTPPGRAACALSKARALLQWEELERAGLVRVRAIPEEDNYFDVFGKPDDKAEYAEQCRIIERDGCWVVISEVWTGDKWLRADSIGMCTGYADPTDPFQNDYVPDLMRAALELVPASGEH